MPAKSFFSVKYSIPCKGPSDSPLECNIPLSQSYQATASQGRIVQDYGNQRPRNHWYFLCYFLHGLLVVLHLVLLVVATSGHAEHRIVIPYSAGSSTKLSAGLQAFYTLYTALLVFVTQRLMLSTIFSRPKKLTQIHDIHGAWAGVGAALNALWQQTKVTSSVLSIAFVMAYFACISVLHVTSSTLMQFQMNDETTTSISPLVGTSPNTSVDLESLDWMAVSPLVPFLQLFYVEPGGLEGNTLYDVPLAGFLTSTVHATTINARCGLLTNLSVDTLEGHKWNVNASTSNSDMISIVLSYPPLLNEIWFPPSIQCSEPICSTFILYLVSTEMEVDGSVDSVNHAYVNGTYDSPDGTTQNFSTPIYLVACSLNATNHTATLNFTLGLPSLSTVPEVAEWSTFSPGGDPNLTSAISYAMKSANSLPSSPYCQPTMSYPTLWANITVFNAYMRTALGMDVSPCYGTPTAQYTSAPSSLTRGRFESTVSQIAADFIWLAGQLGEAGGGFDLQLLEYQIVGTTEQWSLNINILPVIIALCTSVLLLILVLCVLWRHPPARVSGASMLEVMWLGSRSRVLRDRLRNVLSPSLDVLRGSAMFETIFWAHATYANGENNDHCAVIPLCNSETCSRCSVSLGLSETKSGTLRLSDSSQSTPLHASRISHATQYWCYSLHVVFIGLHIALLTLLFHHPEESLVIPYESDTITIGTSALLQAIYTLYTSVLIHLMQRLALLKIVSERQILTTVHDVSGAWTGIGAAIYVLWKQRKPSSVQKIIAVVAYLAMILVLHIASSSIMGWQSYIPVVALQTNMATPDNTVDISQLQWTEISPIARFIATQTADSPWTLVGLQNSTIYDLSQGNGVLTGPINATTFTAQCGLVPNLTLSFQNAEGQYQINFLNGTNNGTFLENPIWKDVVYTIAPTTECIACPQTLFYLITTNINVDESVHDPVSIGLNWTYTPSVGSSQTSTTLTYIAACSLSAQTALVPWNGSSIDLALSSTNTSWSIWSPGNATNLSVGMAVALSKDVAGSFPIFFQGNSSANFTEMDIYIMSALGLNLSYANTTSVSQSSADPSVTLAPQQLESVIARTAATFLWTAGQLGENWGGFQPSVGEAEGTGYASEMWCLHANTIPIIFASIASFSSLVLAIIIIGKGPSRDHPTSISGTSILECLWLEAHSELLHSRLRAVEESHLDTLRAAGMFEICLGDIEPLNPEAGQSFLDFSDE